MASGALCVATTQGSDRVSQHVCLSQLLLTSSGKAQLGANVSSTLSPLTSTEQNSFSSYLFLRLLPIYGKGNWFVFWC